jgi:hypothetical protein
MLRNRCRPFLVACLNRRGTWIELVSLQIKIGQVFGSPVFPLLYLVLYHLDPGNTSRMLVTLLGLAPSIYFERFIHGEDVGSECVVVCDVIVMCTQASLGYSGLDPSIDYVVHL